MGPRSFNRGNRPAPDRAKGVVMASMGPRSFNRGNAHDRQQRRAAGVQLQWGRGLSTAEMPVLYGLVWRVTRWLQWGRGLSTAEIKEAVPLKKEVVELQWGRGLSTAEISNLPSDTKSMGNSFNGAAVFQPRKSVPP